MTRAPYIPALLLLGILLTSPGCGTPETSDGSSGTAKPRSWEEIIVDLERFVAGKTALRFGDLRRRILGMSSFDLDRFVNRLGDSSVFLAGYTVKDEKSRGLRRTQYLYIHFPRAVVMVEVFRDIQAGRGGSFQERARISDVVRIQPGKLLRADVARARLACRDWRIAVRAFDDTDTAATRLSEKLRHYARKEFLWGLRSQPWLPGEKDRAMTAARFLAYRERVEARAFSESARKAADLLRRSFVDWAGGRGKDEVWRRILAEAFRKSGDTEAGGTQRLLDLMCLLEETGHGSDLPRTFSGPDLGRNYTDSFSKALVDGMRSALDAGGESAGVAALALWMKSDPYLTALFRESHATRWKHGLLAGMRCESPVLRALSCEALEKEAGCLAAVYDPFAPLDRARRAADTVQARFERTGFGPSREEAVRKRRRVSVMRTLEVLASLRNLAVKEVGASVDAAGLAARAERKKMKLGLVTGHDGVRDRNGFLYAVRPAAGSPVIEAFGRLWEGEPEVTFFLDARIGRPGVRPGGGDASPHAPGATD
jgi:hypothetical protein